jgi:membrane protease YdiL (CAAX protease family)
MLTGIYTIVGGLRAVAYTEAVQTIILVFGSVLLTSITFAAMHFISVAYLPSATIPIFVINTLTMGLACGILMIKTDSIWGAYLLHAAADLFLFIATLAAH